LPPPRSPLFPYTTLFRSAQPELRGSRYPTCHGETARRFRLFSQLLKPLRKHLNTCLVSPFGKRGILPAGAPSPQVFRCLRNGFKDRKSTRLNSSHRTISY